MNTQIQKMQAKIDEATARLEVVRDILSVETHPQERKRYAMEAGRIKSRIQTYQHKIKYAR
jgi:predicted  nucleic acid-binding Zn-ribbon protein|tara:strand:- start:66 stop:248 length:183 start_codon:yes stop_codon:yes gene_type:complete